VIEIESRYVRAICGVAQSYCEMALRGIPDSAVAVSHAHQAAERAVQLDPDMMLAPACMGSALTLSWKWREAEIGFKQALGLGEHAGTYRQYAMLIANGYGSNLSLCLRFFLYLNIYIQLIIQNLQHPRSPRHTSARTGSPSGPNPAWVDTHQ
jgi:hypothetical protein